MTKMIKVVLSVWVLTMAMAGICISEEAGEEDSGPFSLELQAISPGIPVIHQGEEVVFQITLSNAVKRAMSVKLDWRITDYDDKIVQNGKKNISLKTGETASFKIPFTAKTNGYYILSAEGKAGKETVEAVGGFTFEIEKGKKPSWNNAVAAVVPPVTPGYKPNSIFGLHAGPRNEEEFAVLEKMGVKWLRYDFVPLQGILTGNYSSKRDKFAALAKKHHISLIPIFGYSYWMAEKLELNDEIRQTIAWGGRFTGANPVRDIEQWKQSIYKTVERYQDCMKHWEIWNEVDLAFYCGTVDEYLALLKASYCEIKRIDPKLKVISGNTCMCPYFAEKIVANQGYYYYDYTGLHCYTPVPNLTASMNRGVYEYARHFYKEYEYSKPIINTESSNYQYTPGSVFLDSKKESPGDAIKTFVLTESRGIEKYCYFVNWLVFNGYKGKMFPRPAAVAITVAASILEDGRFLGRLDLGDPQVYAYVFQKKRKPIIVCWHERREGKKEVELELGADSVTLIDKMGHSEIRKTLKGTLKLMVINDPVFIKGANKKILALAKLEPRQVEMNELMVKYKDMPARRLKEENLEPLLWPSCKIKGRVRRFGRWPKELLIADPFQKRSYAIDIILHNYLNKKVNGNLWIEVPKGWKVAPGKKPFAVESFTNTLNTFTITVPATSTYGKDFAFTIKGEISDGRKLIPYTVQTELRSKFDLYLAWKADKADATLYHVTVKAVNRDPSPQSGKIVLKSLKGKVNPAEAVFEPVKKLDKAEAEFTLRLPAGVAINQYTPIWAEVFQKGKSLGIAVSGLRGEWQYKVGDDPQFKEPGFDDSKWEKRSVPTGYLPEKQPWFVGYVWYRTDFFVPQDWRAKELILNLGTMKDAAEIYLNGKLVGKCGGLPPDFWCGWGYPAKYIIPDDMMNFGATNVVAVRTYTESGSTGIHEGPQEIIPLQ